MYIEKRGTKMKGIPLVITCHPLLKDFLSVIRKHLYILYLSKEVKEIFTCKLQYEGKTVDEFRLRWNSYKMNNRNFLKGQTCMQQHLSEHFASETHCSFIEDINIIFIDKPEPKDLNGREHCWRHILKIMTPLGLNVEDD